MTDDAEAYLGRYLAAAGPRLRWLREQSAQTGGPAEEDLDFSRDSLSPLWSWAMGRFRLRLADRPVDMDRLPMWCARRVEAYANAYSEDTLELADGLIYYFAECLLRALPGARWAVGHSPLRNYVSEGQPVISRLRVQIDPFPPVSTFIGRVFDGPSSPYYQGPATPNDLQRAFDTWLANPAVGGATPKERA